jgi:hypothetical protein
VRRVSHTPPDARPARVHNGLPPLVLRCTTHRRRAFNIARVPNCTGHTGRYHDYVLMTCLADAWARPRSPRIAARVPRRHHRGRLAAVDSGNISVSVETDWQELRTWLVNGGGEVGSVRLGECKLGDSLVRGLLATAPCAAGQTLVTVPLRLAFVDSGVQPPYPGAPWNVTLACKLLQVGYAAANDSIFNTLPSLCSGFQSSCCAKPQQAVG